MLAVAVAVAVALLLTYATLPCGRDRPVPRLFVVFWLCACTWSNNIHIDIWKLLDNSSRFLDTLKVKSASGTSYLKLCN
ncbi:hypothetical protein F5B18DRAFT_595573, partial [Nemania serpens]